MNVLALSFYLVFFPILFGCLIECCCGLGLGLRVRYWWEGFFGELLIFYIVKKCLTFLQMDFGKICNIYRDISVLLAVITLGVAVYTLKDIRKEGKKAAASLVRWSWREAVSAGIFLLFIIFQVIKLGSVLEAYPGDHMATYVSTIVSDSSLSKSNPFTGMPYRTSELKIEYSSLTVFYAFLTQVFQINTIAVVYKIIPVWILCLFYGVQFSLGQELFQNDRAKTFLYCSAVAFVNIFGTVKKWILSSFLLLYPWTDDTILACLLLPMLVWMLIKFLFFREKRRDICLLVITVLLLPAEKESFFYIVSMGIVGVILFVIRRAKNYE